MLNRWSDRSRLFWMCAWISTMNSVTSGYDSSMMNALQILPSYWGYFNLTTATLALNAAIINVGSVCATPFGGYLSNKWGRKIGILITSSIAIIGVIIQTAAVNEAMFAIGRFLIGVSVATSYAAIPSYLSEVAHPGDREFLVGLWGSAYNFGSILSAAITFGSQYIVTTWSWRLPSLIQLLPSALSLIVLPFCPESPRWLIYHDRNEEAQSILIKYHGGGDPTSTVATVEYEEISRTLAYEKQTQKVGFRSLIATKANRWKLGIVATIGIFTQLSGGNIVSYYLGLFLTSAGITSTKTQLGINIGLSIFSLITSVAGSHAAKYWGRRPSFMYCTICLGLLLIIETVLTRIYLGSTNTAASAGIVFVVFIFSGFNSFIWAPLSGIYAIEVLSFSIRAHGLSAFAGILYCTTFFNVYVIPYAMRITWGFYLITGLWCFIEVIIMHFYWPETLGLTLEEVDIIFEPERADKAGTTLQELQKVDVINGVEEVNVHGGSKGLDEIKDA